jgi:protein-disulfide isomerase-like protein with CxxC motif
VPTITEERNARLRKEYGAYTDANLATLIANLKMELPLMASKGKTMIDIQRENARLKDMQDARDLLFPPANIRGVPTTSVSRNANLKQVKVSHEERQKINQDWAARVRGAKQS